MPNHQTQGPWYDNDANRTWCSHQRTRVEDGFQAGHPCSCQNGLFTSWARCHDFVVARPWDHISTACSRVLHTGEAIEQSAHTISECACEVLSCCYVVAMCTAWKVLAVPVPRRRLERHLRLGWSRGRQPWACSTMLRPRMW